MATQLTLTNPEVNGGTPVVFNGATLNYIWKNLTRVTPLTNSFTISEAQVAGFENPKMSVTGFINTNNISSNVVTQSLLQEFASVPYDGTDNTATTLSVSTGDNDVYVKDYDSSNNSVRVIIETFNMTVDANDSNLGHFWRYTLTLTETK